MAASKNALVLDDKYLPVLLRLLDQAKASVDALAFSFAVGSAGGRHNISGSPYKVAQKLIAAKARGVNVRLYIEMQRDTAARNAVTVRLLKDAGIEVRHGQTHAKGFLIDGKRLLFGSTNLTNQSLHKNRETNVLTNDKQAIKEFQTYFNAMWKGAKHGGVPLEPPLFADGDFFPELIDFIDGAKRSLAFSIYFFDLRDVEKALLRAHKRDVQITGVFGRHQSFAWSYVRRTVATAERLRRGGIKALRYGSPVSFTHSKYVVRDAREILLGTGNWLAEDVLIHPQLYMLIKDKASAAALVRHLKQQMKQEGAPV